MHLVYMHICRLIYINKCNKLKEYLAAIFDSYWYIYDIIAYN